MFTSYNIEDVELLDVSQPVTKVMYAFGSCNRQTYLHKSSPTFPPHETLIFVDIHSIQPSRTSTCLYAGYST